MSSDWRRTISTRRRGGTAHVPTEEQLRFLVRVRVASPRQFGAAFDHDVWWAYKRIERLCNEGLADRGRPLRDFPGVVWATPEGLGAVGLARVSPDATLGPELPAGRRVEALVELDRTRRATKNESKLLRYDALITAWWRSVERYRSLGEPPVVVFVCQSDHDLLELVGLAHRQVTGCLQNPGEPAERSRFPGRERMLFVSEREIHDGAARAQMLVPRPPEAGESSAVATREVRLPSR